MRCSSASDLRASFSSARPRTAPASSTGCAPAITKALIERRGFHFVAVEADWPDAARIDDYVLGDQPPLQGSHFTPFARFPTWMWRNEEVARIRRMVARPQPRSERPPRPASASTGSTSTACSRRSRRSWPTSTTVDPDAARAARDPLRRAHALAEGSRGLRPGGPRRAATQSSESAVVAMLRELLEPAARLRPAATASASSTPPRTRASSRTPSGTTAPCTTAPRARGTCATRHMFDTLQALLAFLRARSRRASSGRTTRTSATLSATEMGARGEHNVGQLCRARFGDDAYVVGFGDRPRHRGRRARTGTSRWSDARPPRAPRQLRARLPRVACPGVRPAPARPQRAAPCATSSTRLVSSAPSASSTGPRPSCQPLLRRQPSRPVRRAGLVRRDQRRQPLACDGSA